MASQILESPLTWFWGLLFISLLLVWRGSRWGKSLLLVSLSWLFVISSTPIPQWLVVRLESRFLPISLRNVPDSSYVLVLGGGHTISRELPAVDQLSYEAIARLTEALRIYTQMKPCKLVFSGYSSSGRVSQAEVMGVSAISLGVSPSDTLLSSRARNTHEEVRAFVSRFGTNKPVVLVTSAVHMLRATRWCKVYHLDVIPAPTGHLMKIDDQVNPYDFIPSFQKILLMQKVIHESLGLLLVPDHEG